MSRSVYSPVQAPIEVQDDSVATTLKVIMDVLKVSWLESENWKSYETFHRFSGITLIATVFESFNNLNLFPLLSEQAA